jgi:hypothetical protein
MSYSCPDCGWTASPHLPRSYALFLVDQHAHTEHHLLPELLADMRVTDTRRATSAALRA